MGCAIAFGCLKYWNKIVVKKDKGTIKFSPGATIASITQGFCVAIATNVTQPNLVDAATVF